MKKKAFLMSGRNAYLATLDSIRELRKYSSDRIAHPFHEFGGAIRCVWGRQTGRLEAPNFLFLIVSRKLWFTCQAQCLDLNKNHKKLHS